MINVFIDTSVFVAEGFVKGKCIATLFDAAQAEMIHILMPDITEHEIRCHLHEEVEKNNGGKYAEKLKSSYMYALDDLRTHIEALMAVDAVTLIERVEDELDHQLHRADIERLPLSDDIDLKDIVGDYKDLKPPFSTKKKYEFPDAIALRQLEAWCIDHNDKCILLAKDPDLKNYQSEYLEYKELTDFVSSLEEFEKMISQEKLKNVFELSKERIEKRIQDWVYEQYGDEMIYINHLLIEDINDSSINKIDIQWDEPFKWIGKEEGSLFYKTYANITASISVGHPDYDTGYYDSEDQQWYFINENIGNTMEARLRVPIAINYYYGVEEMELDSINIDNRLSLSDKCGAIVQIGEKEYFDSHPGATKADFVRTYHNDFSGYFIDKYAEVLEEKGLRWERESLEKAEISNLDGNAVMAMLMGVIRADRFTEGTLLSFCKSGHISNWLRRLLEIDQEDISG